MAGAIVVGDPLQHSRFDEMGESSLQPRPSSTIIETPRRRAAPCGAKTARRRHRCSARRGRLEAIARLRIGRRRCPRAPAAISTSRPGTTPLGGAGSAAQRTVAARSAVSSYVSRSSSARTARSTSSSSSTGDLAGLLGKRLDRRRAPRSTRRPIEPSSGEDGRLAHTSGTSGPIAAKGRSRRAHRHATS